jgi:hypothetical protein
MLLYGFLETDILWSRKDDEEVKEKLAMTVVYFVDACGMLLMFKLPIKHVIHILY